MRPLDELRRFADVSSLKSNLQRMAAQFGAARRLDILTSVHEGRRQAICFLRMQTPEQEQALMKSLGVGRFGGEIVFVVDLQTPDTPEDTGPSSQWASCEEL